MKKFIFTLILTLSAHEAMAQKVLFVNDNDDVISNNDTLINSLKRSKYKNFDHYNIADSAGIVPTAMLMNKYDVVIWYTSTDGVGLRFWKDTSAINPNIKVFVDAGKSLWIIGQDLLYDAYGKAPIAFKSGEFTHDYMGILAYENQSYTDDGSLGVAQLDRSAVSSNTFPTKLQWIFSTLWYVDGCTLRNGVESIYKMGPSTYSLAGYDAMFYSKLQNKKVMTSLFDPSLINAPSSRVSFLNAGLDYLLLMANVREFGLPAVEVYPNPSQASAQMRGDFNLGDEVLIFNAFGQNVKTMKITRNANEVALDSKGFTNGQYFLQVKRDNQAIFQGKWMINN